MRKLDCKVGETSLDPDKVGDRRTERSIELSVKSEFRQLRGSGARKAKFPITPFFAASYKTGGIIT